MKLTEELRKSGVEVMGDIPWGTHFCQFYETKKDLLDLLVPYFKAGLENNEFCLWVTSDPITSDEAFHALEYNVPGFKHFLKKKSFEIVESTNLYPEGEFNATEMIKGLDDKLNKALKAGYEGMRGNGIESWVENENWENFMEYEGELNISLEKKRMIILCTYPLTESPGSSILDVAHVHQRVIAKRRGHWEVLEEPELIEIKSELLKTNYALDQKVKERTKDLIKTIEVLEIEINERKKIEKELKKSEARYRTLVEQASDAILITDQHGNLLEENSSFCKMFGYSKNELNKMNMASLVDPGQLQTDPLRFDLLLEGSNIFRERKMRKKDGTIFDIEENVKMLPDKRILAIVRDITERKKAEDTLSHSYQQIRSLTEHLQNIREEERIGIAREIHDELGQRLTVLKMDVSWLTKKLTSSDDATKNKLKDLHDLLDSTVKSIRKISYELRPILLDEFGLAAAIDWYLKEFEKRSAIRSHFNRPKKELQINEAVKTNLFRIFQESLTNIARHSDASEVRIDLSQNNDQVHLCIRDNGKGFNKEKIADIRTLGILGMKERAASLGGHYKIQTEPEKGTTVLVIVPLFKKI